MSYHSPRRFSVSNASIDARPLSPTTGERVGLRRLEKQEKLRAFPHPPRIWGHSMQPPPPRARPPPTFAPFARVLFVFFVHVRSLAAAFVPLQEPPGGSGPLAPCSVQLRASETEMPSFSNNLATTSASSGHRGDFGALLGTAETGRDLLLPLC